MTRLPSVVMTVQIDLPGLATEHDHIRDVVDELEKAIDYALTP
jgi:hypothetical protein